MPEVRDDLASNVPRGWKFLKDDKRAIFKAASHAQRAVDFLRGLQQPKAAIQTKRTFSIYGVLT